MDEEEKRYREVEKRERLVQTFLIIGGFLLAYSPEKIKQGMVSIFSAYLLFVIVYYIYLSRTTRSNWVDLCAFNSSLFFSLLILIFVNSQLALSSLRSLSFFIVLTGALTFSLLSPESSENITKGVEKFGDEQEKKHPKLVKIIGILFLMIVFAWLIYTLKQSL